MFDTYFIAWAAGIIFSLIGWGTFIHFAWIARYWPRSRGRVIDNVARFTHGGASASNLRQAVYFPLIEFDARGETHHAQGGIGRNGPWEMGETIELYYKPTNPRHILDFNLPQRLIFSGVFIGFGVASFAAALGILS